MKGKEAGPETASKSRLPETHKIYPSPFQVPPLLTLGNHKAILARRFAGNLALLKASKKAIVA